MSEKAEGDPERSELVKELRAVWLESRPGTMHSWPAAFRLKPGLQRDTFTNSQNCPSRNSVLTPTTGTW